MARFTFTLQTVLDQREREEHLLQVGLAQAQVAQRKLEGELAAIESDLKSQNDQMRDHHLIGKIDVSIIATHRRFLIGMRAGVIAMAQRIAAARLNVEAAQRKLGEAAKQRKAIDVLRERQRQRWLADEAKKELAHADDVGMQIAYHNLRGHTDSFGSNVA